MGSKSKTLALLLVALFLLSLATFELVRVNAQTRTLIVPDQYTTIQDAIDHASAGDTVFVKQGTYYTYVNDAQQLTIDKPITLIGENPENTILDGTNKSRIYTSESPYHPYVSLAYVNITSSNVNISGFTIRDCDTGIILSDSQEPISRVKITENAIINSSISGSFYGEGNAITIIGKASNIVISQNNITDNKGIGIITFGEQNDNLVINNNRIKSNQEGLSLQASNSLIEDNNIFENDEKGISVIGSSNVTVRNNILTGNGAANFFPQYYGGLNDSGALMLEACEFTYVYNNNITGNHKYGIMLLGINNSVVSNNAIMSNGAGIRLINYVYGNGLYTFHRLGSGSMVFDNNFISNSPNAIVDSFGPFYIPEDVIGNGTDVVSWDSGQVGNYWSDYNGSGTYVIDQNNVDHHPLSQPVDINSIAPTPTPTSIGSLSLGSVIPIIAVGILAIAVISLLLYRRHRKSSNLSK